ncbi:MAG: hypothetical protein COB17_06200 [Sulfurimonas sp.]|nr:MAG: hypothetical protein COB17_06200 [Sulfurimonas sp.]
MNTSYALDSYRNRDLNIEMRTSSGDKINLDFANYQSSSIKYEGNENDSSTSMSFSSMQSFQFSIKSNGIDAQDQKEIDAFMKIAQPFIDDFLKELEDSTPKSPVSQLARQIAGIFEPSRDRNENEKNQIKTNMVEMFDKSLQTLEFPQLSDTNNLLKDIFKQTQNLLEKTLKEFDSLNKKLYA